MAGGELAGSAGARFYAGTPGQMLGAPEARPRKRLDLRTWAVIAVLVVSGMAAIMLINFVTRPREKSLGTAVQPTDVQWPETPAIAARKTPLIQDERLE